MEACLRSNTAANESTTLAFRTARNRPWTTGDAE
jgi:hypothetical protein